MPIRTHILQTFNHDCHAQKDKFSISHFKDFLRIIFDLQKLFFFVRFYFKTLDGLFLDSIIWSPYTLYGARYVMVDYLIKTEQRALMGSYHASWAPFGDGDATVQWSIVFDIL